MDLYDLADPDPAPAAPDLRPAHCPLCGEGERVAILRPCSRPELLRVASRLAPRAETLRCLLLAPPCGLSPAWLPVTPADLRRWAADARRRLGRPVLLLAPSPADPAAPPCAATPRERPCQAHPALAQAESARHIATLVRTAESLDQAIAAGFPALTPRDHALLHAWATLPEPRRPNAPITTRALAKRFALSERHASRILRTARLANPSLHALLLRQRRHRLKPTGAYQVRTT